MHQILIRACTEQDLTAVVQLERHWEREAIAHGDFDPLSQETFRSILERFPAYFLVADSDRQLVGYIHGSVQRNKPVAVIAEPEPYARLRTCTCIQTSETGRSAERCWNGCLRLHDMLALRGLWSVRPVRIRSGSCSSTGVTDLHHGQFSFSSNMRALIGWSAVRAVGECSIGRSFRLPAASGTALDEAATASFAANRRRIVGGGCAARVSAGTELGDASRGTRAGRNCWTVEGNARRVLVDAAAGRRGWPPARRRPWAAPPAILICLTCWPDVRVLPGGHLLRLVPPGQGGPPSATTSPIDDERRAA